MNDEIIKLITGIDRQSARESRTCATCGQPIGTFRDALSEREAKISQMCQKCQDQFFREEA